MLHEVGIAREVVVLAMLEHEDTILLQQSFLEYHAGYGGQFLQGVGRVGKDEVEGLFARLDKSEHVAPQGQTGVGVQLLQTLLYETVVVAIQFYADDLGTTTRKQFEGDAACAGEQVEGLGTFKVDVA